MHQMPNPLKMKCKETSKVYLPYKMPDCDGVKVGTLKAS